MIKPYKDYLAKKHYATSTIQVYSKDVKQYLDHLENEGMPITQISYKEILPYFFQLKKESSEGVVKRKILAIRHLYDMLEVKKNPASGIHIRSRKANRLTNIIAYEKLIELDEKYETANNRSKRNKVMLGMLIYQGLKTSELQRLYLEDVKLKQQQIYIRSTRKSNSRKLKIEAAQLLELQEYLLITRPQLLVAISDERAGRRLDKIDPIIAEKLFFSQHGSIEIKNSLKHMFRGIQKINPMLSSAKIIRSTVIAEWIKTRDIRKVQYMCGHKYVSSTEHYKAYNVEELKDQLKKYHPLSE